MPIYSAGTSRKTCCRMHDFCCLIYSGIYFMSQGPLYITEAPSFVLWYVPKLRSRSPGGG